MSALVAAGLSARTERLDEEPDLLAVAGNDGFLFQREGLALAGRGVALTVAPEEAEQALAAVHVDAGGEAGLAGVPGSGPVAVGALPFAAGAPGALTIPAMVVGVGGGVAWRTTIGPAGEVRRPSGSGRSGGTGDSRLPEADLPGPDGASTPPDSYRLGGGRSHQEWCAVVARALEAIAGGELEKVVVARDVVVDANRPILPVHVLPRLLALHPGCTVFSTDGFVGASPELLVARSGLSVRSHPLAGTAVRTGDPAADARRAAAMLESPKQRHEHAVVVDAVAAALAPLCTMLDVPTVPSIVDLRNVSHLGTLVTGTLTSPAPSALALAMLLHPTPATAGTPAAAALAWLEAEEGMERGRYGGPVGWVDARGDGEWVVGIRSAELDGCRARLFAGAGVVAGSDPEIELAETQLKLQALLAAIVRP